MNSTQIDAYMNSILSRLTQEEEGASDGENILQSQPPPSLDHWLTQIQSMMNEEASSVSNLLL